MYGLFTHDLDLIVSRSKFEIALFEEWGRDHDRNVWVTMVGWVDVRFIDWGDFRRRAVDISIFAYIMAVVLFLHW